MTATRPSAYRSAGPDAQVAYDAARARNETAWLAYNKLARDPAADDRPAWAAYLETLTPLDKATAGLTPAPEPTTVTPPALPAAGPAQMALF